MSRYSNFTLNSGEYVPQYAGSPLNVVNDTNTELQNRHYKNIDDLSNIQIALQQTKAQLGEAQRPYVDAQAAQIEEALQQFAKSGAENSTAKVNELARRFKGDEQLMRMVNYAKQVELDKQRGAEMQLKTGKNVLYQPDFYEFNKMTPDDERFLKGYTPSASTELDLNEAMASVIDRVKPDTWTDLNLSKEDIASLKSDPTKLTGYLNKLDIASNVPKLNKLKEELQKAFENTDAYKQQINYKASNPETLKNKLLDYTQLSKFTNEQVGQIKDLTLDTIKDRLAIQQLSQPVTAPYSPGNYNEAYNVPVEKYQEVEKSITDFKTTLSNVQKPGFIDPTTKLPITPERREQLTSELSNKIDLLDNQLNSSRKVVEEKEFNWKDLYTQVSGSLEAKGGLDRKRMTSYPKSEEELQDWIRSGKVAPMSGNAYTPSAKLINNLVDKYKNRLEEYRENLKFVNKAKTFQNPLDAAGKPLNADMQAVESSLKGMYLGNTELLDPVTGEQITTQSITEKLGSDYAFEGDSEKYRHAPELDIIKMSDEMINGKVILEVTPQMKSVNGIVRPAKEKFQITLGNQEAARQLMKQQALGMTNNANRSSRAKMIGLATFGEQLDRVALPYIKGETKLLNLQTPEGNQEIYVVPLGKDENNRNNKFNLKIGNELVTSPDGTPFPFNDRSEIATYLGNIIQ